MKFFVFLTAFLALSMLMNFNAVLAQESASLNVSEPGEIEVLVSLNKGTFSPGDVITILGEAKRDGVEVSGSVEIKFDDRYVVPLKYGKFKWESVLSEKTKSGEREISVKVITSDGEEEIVYKKISVNPVPGRLDVYVNGNSFSPESTINASAILRDQNSEPINSEIVMTLYDSRGATVLQKTLVGGGGELSYALPRDAVPGEWWVYAYSNDIKSRRFFHIEEYPRISTEIKDDVLRIKNTGNVPYISPVSITFSNGASSSIKTLDVNIGVGGEYVVELTAPNGYYNLKVNSGNMESYFNGVSLTGGAVGVKTKYTTEHLLVAALFAMFVLIAGAVIRFRETVSKVLEKAIKIMSNM